MEDLYADDHAAHPTRVIYGSENKHALSAWEAVEQNDYIAGQFLWTGIDYLGEADVWPSHGSPAGLLNLAGFPKSLYYYRQSLWSEKPMVYLSTQRSFRRYRATTESAQRGVYCFTNCDQVELFHDGKSLGTKRHAPGEFLTWPVNFTSGVLRAVGKKGIRHHDFRTDQTRPRFEADVEIRCYLSGSIAESRGPDRSGRHRQPGHTRAGCEPTHPLRPDRPRANPWDRKWRSEQYRGLPGAVTQRLSGQDAGLRAIAGGRGRYKAGDFVAESGGGERNAARAVVGGNWRLRNSEPSRYTGPSEKLPTPDPFSALP